MSLRQKNDEQLKGRSRKYGFAPIRLGQSVGKENFELRVNFSPIPAPSGPFFCDIDLCEIKHFQKRFVIRKYCLAFGYFSELPIEIFYGICCINQRSDRLRILKIC